MQKPFLRIQKQSYIGGGDSAYMPTSSIHSQHAYNYLAGIRDGYAYNYLAGIRTYSLTYALTPLNTYALTPLNTYTLITLHHLTSPS